VIEVRERTDDDIEGCARLVEEVRRLDGYPPYLPDNDYRGLFTDPSQIVAYVATAEDTIVGHVALHRSTGDSAMALACNALGVEAARLGVVVRLFSAVDRRREGVGRTLLGVATHAARSHGLVPILDVWVELRAAVALYESSGWTRLGTVIVVLPSGAHDVDVFAASS
jgi:GNAT superfamily N-acetyltransferase